MLFRSDDIAKAISKQQRLWMSVSHQDDTKHSFIIIFWMNNKSIKLSIPLVNSMNWQILMLLNVERDNKSIRIIKKKIKNYPTYWHKHLFQNESWILVKIKIHSHVVQSNANNSLHPERHYHRNIFLTADDIGMSTA